jgi:hypothetical protein
MVKRARGRKFGTSMGAIELSPKKKKRLAKKRKREEERWASRSGPAVSKRIDHETGEEIAVADDDSSDG